MKSLAKNRSLFMILCVMLIFAWALTAQASSDDNSLSDLGITTEGVTVEPQFAYDTWEYNVTVPAGTTELSLNPVPSSSSATVTEVSGTTLNTDGTGTVLITVTSGSGQPFTYTLHVTSAAAPQPQTEAQTQAQTEKQTETEAQTEAQTEDSQYVKVDKNTIQEAENTITELKGEITSYRGTVSLYTKIMYGLIALSVLLLFMVINLLLKKKDLKAELNDYRSYGYSTARPENMLRQDQPVYAQPGRRQTGYPMRETPKAGADHPHEPGPEVIPQTSRKPRILPEYEDQPQAGRKNADIAQGTDRPAPREAAAEKKAARQEEADKKQRGKSDQDIHIDMIDL